MSDNLILTIIFTFGLGTTHTLPFDGLSEVYESSIVDYIEKPELGFFQKFYRLLIKSYYYIFS